MPRATTIILVAVSALTVGTLAAGCQEQQGLPQGTLAQAALAADNTPAVMCDKCRTVWIKRPDTNIKGMITLRPEKVMECPDCKSAAENFFQTGKLQHSCKACGGTLEQCRAH